MSHYARGGDRSCRIGPTRKQLLFGVEAAGEAPDSSVVGLDENERAVAVGFLIGFGSKFERLERCVGK
jgi:hypothetical protein